MRLACGSILAFATVVAGCSLDFNEAVPCRENAHCPTEMVCNTTIGRCESGVRPPQDVSGDLAEDVDEEVDAPDLTVDVIDETDVGPGDPMEDFGPEDLQDEEPTVADADADDPASDATGEVCVPTAEVCNGLDDDCNGTADDGISCGSCPDSDGMIAVTRPGTDPFCVDIYEASRPDATLVAVGVQDSMATSRNGVLPWNDVSLSDAEAACIAAGKRLCTTEEWTEACGGPQAWLYPYNATTYDTSSCNGTDVTPSVPVATGTRLLCESPEGFFDMSGNVEEWVAESSTRGGSFADGNVALRCTGTGEMPDSESPGTEVGFRCCADAE